MLMRRATEHMRSAWVELPLLRRHLVSFSVVKLRFDPSFPSSRTCGQFPACTYGNLHLVLHLAVQPESYFFQCFFFFENASRFDFL